VFAHLVLEFHPAWKGTRRRVVLFHMFCKKTDGSSNPRLVLSPVLLLTDNIRERHLVLENVSDEVQVKGSGGITVEPLLDYCQNEEGVAF
jgi:hypothetical protein